MSSLRPVRTCFYVRCLRLEYLTFPFRLTIYDCNFSYLAVSREFSGNGYLKYDIVGNQANKPINSNEDVLRVKFKTVQPTGLLFHTQNSGGELGDHYTLELCGGRLWYCGHQYCKVSL